MPSYFHCPSLSGGSCNRLSTGSMVSSIFVFIDSLARVELNLKGKGANFEEAKNKAKLIKYDFKLTDSTFTAPDYFVLPQDAGIGYHDIEVVIYLPEGTLARFNERFGERYRSYINKDAFNLGNNIEYTYLIQDGKAVCQDCPVVDESINTRMEPLNSKMKLSY